MAQTVSFMIGATVRCSDGDCGAVKRVVVDPVAETITHLVVEPHHRQGLGKLVPVDLAQPAADGGVNLSCTLEQFEQLDWAEETQFVPGTRGYEEYGPEQVLSWPYYGVKGGQSGGVSGANVPWTSETVTYDSVPSGEVEVRRGEPVYATDGPIGKVHGLVMDPASHRVSHVLLAEGHLWGHKDVAIPISAVDNVDDGIKLRITKQEVEDLPAVTIDR
jgi:sporulation protein YlmC with PRC-barrel domain